MSFPQTRHLSAIVLLLSLLALPARAADKADNESAEARLALRTASALYEGIRTVTLDNGLRVYLKPVPDAPLVTTLVAYKVGSADEELTSTGLSHYLEHLMFKGTRRLMPGDIDRITLRNGGANNAYTSEDYTIYFFDFPPGHWQEALRIEADRMQNLQIDKRHEFEKEKGAVISELKRNEDEPWDLELKAILPLLFGKKGPYGHPVIGEEEHVKDATAAIIKSHYNRWYHPNNAALVMCGSFDPDQAEAQIKKLFGPIPRAKLPPRKIAKPIERNGPVVHKMRNKFSAPRLLLGYNTVSMSDPDYPALSVLEAILSEGKTSRLYQSLVEGAQIASSANASNQAGRYPGWFAVQVALLPDKSLEKAEELVLEQIKKLRETPVSAVELSRVKHILLASTIFARESVHNLGDSIARGVTTNDLDFLKRYLPRLLDVTAADVQRVAKKYLDPERRVAIWSQPESSKQGAQGPAQSAPRARAAARAEGGEGFTLKKTKRVQLPNGLVLLLFENRRLPIFVAHAELKDVRLLEPEAQQGVASLTGRLLDEGTSKHTGTQIAEMIENVGGSLSLHSSGGSVQVLAPDRRLGLRLLFECLMEPSFPKEAFAREQKKQLAAIEELETLPDARARQAFRAAVYGKHPYARSSLGTLAAVKALTPASCADFHRRAFVPNNSMLALVGDFDSDEMIAEVKRLTADWKKRDLKLPVLPKVTRPKAFTQTILSMPSAAQLHFFMGHVGIRRNNPDYYKLLVMDYVLGTGPGFTDRLSARLRDREGLAYTVNANITNSAGLEPGVFMAYIGTDNENFDRVKREFLEELTRIRKEEPKKQEVEDAKAYLLGNLLLGFTTNAGIAGHLLSIEKYHLGFDYLADYRKAVSAVTPADVQEVAKKYIDPSHMILIAAGAVDTSGKPLAKKKEGER